MCVCVFVCVCVCVCVCNVVNTSVYISSGCRADKTDFSGSLSPSISLFLPLSSSILIIHRSKKVLQTTPCVRKELMYISSCWLANTGIVCRGSWKNITCELVLASPSVSRMSCSSFVFRGWILRLPISGRTAYTSVIQ